MTQDHVAAIIEQWRRERPDLDPSPMAVIGRISRLSRHVERKLEANFKRHGLQGGSFDLLAALRRRGDPYVLTPTQLQNEMMLSSGATTHRIDLLEERGLVERRDDPNDRRGTLVRLTEVGRCLVDEAVESHVALEQELLSPFSQKQQDELAALLAELAAAFDGAGAGRPERA